MLKILRNKIYQQRKKYWQKTIALCYHRVGDYIADPFDLSISTQFFLNQMLYLKNNYNLLSIEKLEDSLKKQYSNPPKSVVLTFDDGYKSSINTIKLLEKLEIPAIFFICSPDINNNFFYWDILSHLLIERKEIPEEDLHLIDKLCKIMNINTLIERNISDIQYQEGLKWKLNDKKIPSTRCEVLKLISEKIEYEVPLKLDIFNKLLYKTNYSITNEKSHSPKLDSLKLKYCSIGGHTMNHYTLSSLSRKMQVREILSNKQKLEKKLKSKIKYFAYPYGSREHYNEHSLEIVKDEFHLAFSNYIGTIHKESNHYELPRFLIGNWNEIEFKKKLNNYCERK